MLPRALILFATRTMTRGAWWLNHRGWCLEHFELERFIMKVLNRNYWPILVLSGAACFASAQAADAVYQRTANDGAIELSNIAEVDGGQVAVTVDSAPSDAAKPGAATTTPAALVRQPVAARGKASAEEDPNATVAEACTERELADALTKEAKEVCEKKKLARAEAPATQGTASNYSAESGGGFSYGASPAASNSGSGSSTTAGGGSNTGTGSGTTTGSGTGTGSGSGTGTTAGTGTGTGSGTPTASVVTPRTDTGGTTPANPAPTVTADSTLATNLQQYRQLMLQEAAAANINDNHAVSRRYLMTNRSTYQAAIGVTP
jgi:hypothetical protein